MIVNNNKDNYIENKGKQHDDQHNRFIAAELINNYFNNNCLVEITDRYAEYDIIVTHNNIMYYCDVKSTNYQSDTQIKIGYNLHQHEKNINSNNTNIRV